jgi:hypothetical protein
MTFRAIRRTDPAAGSASFRVVDEQGRELEWVNRFLDMQCVRGWAPLTLRSYANTLLHFVRWWARRPGIDVTRFTAEQFTEATLVDLCARPACRTTPARPGKHQLPFRHAAAPVPVLFPR